MPLLVLVFLIAFAVLMTLPSVLTLLASIKPATEQGEAAWLPPAHPTFENFIRVWTDGGFSRYFINTALISIVDAAIMIALASMVAYALHFLRLKFKTALSLWFLLGMMVPAAAIVLPLYTTVRTFGLINTHLGVILSDVALALPVFVFLFESYFKKIPMALHEAARVDGASEWQIYRRIIMPASVPVVITTALLEFVWSWNDLLLRLLLLPQDSKRTLAVGLLFFQGSQTRDISGLSAGTVIMALPVVALFLIFQGHFVRGMTQGAVK
ncbi:carbohydrate ABC transporter permease [Mesorhizobium sp. VK25A]|uniref:sn-glycerol-3-phosphate transport system permease protein UgpE n=1 Tax=Mesorhizobium vachelliae TaxID=3072309 RepID=A0ABU5AD86_9HYPH|nr:MULTISPECIES: carbohydrate ABC transporter permease [unclassified Mesorhizobium]MDX8535149.1 carbohydrate ABC transporter permease [Mesorhizobium sp. VK25D]MDX8547925.1 carbohydrate ABC transporter permease [Mesorhizobium sp. VK25A]